MLRPYNNSPLASCICPTPRVSQGFTLIELMIAVAIVGILAAVALPSYQRSIMKGRRVDAKAATLDLAAREERYFSVNNTYTNSAVSLGFRWHRVSAGGQCVRPKLLHPQCDSRICWCFHRRHVADGNPSSRYRLLRLQNRPAGCSVQCGRKR